MCSPNISNVMPPSQYSINKRNLCHDINISSGPQHKKPKRSRKSIQFSPRVSVRCFVQCGLQLQTQQQDSASTSSTKKDQIAENRSRAKVLAKLWRSDNTNQASTGTGTGTISSAVRSEIKGESLRGFEHLTCVSIGQKRCRTKKDAVRVALAEESTAILMDSGKLANAYGIKSRGARVYAEHVAMEDAKVAAEILAEDLRGDSFPPLSLPCCNSSSLDFSSVERTMKTIALFNCRGRVSDEVINSLILKILSRQRSVTAMQA